MVSDILPLPSSSQCITWSNDASIKLWECQSGVCLQTLRDSSSLVMALALHTSGRLFVCACSDQSVGVRSSETLEVLRKVPMPDGVRSLAFGNQDTLHVGVSGHGVMSCNCQSEEIGSVVLHGKGSSFGIAIAASVIPAISRLIYQTIDAYPSSLRLAGPAFRRLCSSLLGDEKSCGTEERRRKGALRPTKQSHRPPRHRGMQRFLTANSAPASFGWYGARV